MIGILRERREMSVSEERIDTWNLFLQILAKRYKNEMIEYINT